MCRLHKEREKTKAHGMKNGNSTFENKYIYLLLHTYIRYYVHKFSTTYVFVFVIKCTLLLSICQQNKNGKKKECVKKKKKMQELYVVRIRMI